MIDATHLKMHRTVSSLALEKEGEGPSDWASKGGLNSKFHAVTAAHGRPIRLFFMAGNVSDYNGVLALMLSFPKAGCLLEDRENDVSFFL